MAEKRDSVRERERNVAAALTNLEEPQQSQPSGIKCRQLHFNEDMSSFLQAQSINKVHITWKK